jgi:hypothetical protein
MLYTNLGGHPSWQGVCDKSFLPCLQNGPLMGTGFGEAWTGSDEGEYKNARFSQFSAERGEKQECKVFTIIPTKFLLKLLAQSACSI